MFSRLRGLFRSNAVKNQPPVAKPTDGWVKYSDTASTAVIFVHGFLSDRVGCWTHSSGAYWPKLVADDSRFGDAAVFSAQYYTRVGSLDYGVADCSAELLGSLSVRDEDRRRAPLDFENIVFVCHSLGGIVVRYTLCNQASDLSTKRIGLVLMASPSLGSAYADAFAWITNIFGNAVGRHLRSNNELLQDLDRRFRVLLESANGRISGTEAVETEFYAHWALTRFAPVIVKWESAARYFGTQQRVGGASHSSIVKPDDKHHASHQFLLKFFLKNFAGGLMRVIATDQISNDKRSVVSKVLFDSYDSSCADFYHPRQIDVEIAKTLEVYAVWVYGASGAGKTCALKHYLSCKNLKPIELSMSQISDDFTREACIRELAETIAQVANDGQTISNSLLGVANALAIHSSRSPIVLYLDEVPISVEHREHIEMFVRFLSDLLILIKQQAGSGSNVVISSIYKPDLYGNAKLSEQLHAIEVPLWTEQELYGLYLKIVNAIGTLEVDDDFLPVLIEATGGSPRFLKAFLKNRFLESGKSDLAILARTKQQFDWRRYESQKA